MDYTIAEYDVLMRTEEGQKELQKEIVKYARKVGVRSKDIFAKSCHGKMILSIRYDPRKKIEYIRPQVNPSEGLPKTKQELAAMMQDSTKRAEFEGARKRYARKHGIRIHQVGIRFVPGKIAHFFKKREKITKTE